MSSHAQQARAAHLRHANRAGGFGGLGDTKTQTEDTLSAFLSRLFGDNEPTTTTTKTKAAKTSTTVAAVRTTTVSSTATSPLVVTASSSSSTPSSTSSSVHTTATHRSSSTYSGTVLGAKTVTHTTPATVSPFAAVASSSSSAVPSTTNALVAPVVGGVIGGIVGLAALIFLVTFCIRRRNRKDEDVANFDPASFRRSAMLIEDPPTHQDTIARGYNPPAPPPMAEKRTMYSATSGSPITPNSGSALIFQAPFSPIAPGPTSPVAAYDHTQVSAPILTRNISATSFVPYPHEPAQNAQYPSPPSPRNTLAVPQPDKEYLDLERTSVTPFQAAQYAEISQRLNTEVPQGLDTPAVDEFIDNKMSIKDTDLPPLPPQEEDPFTDGAAAASAEDEHGTEVTLPMVQELSFPAPPSPVHSVHSVSRYRVDSTPPTLPEIVIHPRVSVTSTYLSEAGSPSAPRFPSGQTVLMQGLESPMGSRFPVTPSPLASSFTVPSPPATNEEFHVTPPAAAQPRPDARARQSVYTVYDPEDAYGGI